jgi:hypothetical protein
MIDVVLCYNAISKHVKQFTYIQFSSRVGCVRLCPCVCVCMYVCTYVRMYVRVITLNAETLMLLFFQNTVDSSPI